MSDEPPRETLNSGLIEATHQASGARKWWPAKALRPHPAAALPARSALSDPPEGLDIETARAALDQVNKRLDAQLALKGTTETRALTLAGQCTTLLSALVAGILYQFYSAPNTVSSNGRIPLMAAGIAGAAFLFLAVLAAYRAASPRNNVALPGYLPDELWSDLVAPSMDGAEFMARRMMANQDVMVQNERDQWERAIRLQHAILMVVAAIPAAVLVATLAIPLSNYLKRNVPSNPEPVTSQVVPIHNPAPPSSPAASVPPVKAGHS